MVDKIMAFLALAFLSESLTEYFFGDWVKTYTKYIAVAFGILLALNFEVDFFMEFLGLPSYHSVIGCVLTGMLLGRGSNWLHDFWKRFILGQPGDE